jgi:hypothetical protein
MIYVNILKIIEYMHYNYFFMLLKNAIYRLKLKNMYCNLRMDSRGAKNEG